MIDTTTLRKKYFDFFVSKQHRLIPSASLLPQNDPTVLFTTAGMHPLVPYLMGLSHAEGRRLVNVQKCIRTQDIEEVGDDWHCTFFEMLGNWSLGDYFKKESIEWSYEFLTKHLGISPEKIAVSVFGGDKDTPADTESVEIWKTLGFSDAKIFRLGRKDNFWGPVGNTGPCGPDTEIFYIAKSDCRLNNPQCSPACSCGKYVEIWNNVFMQYERTPEGQFKPLPQMNVDTGMGLLRVVSLLNGYTSVYQSDAYASAMDVIRKTAPHMPERDQRIIADHVQTALFAISDGAAPSNVGAGYIIRRILRRAFRIANKQNIEPHYIDRLVDVFVDVYKDQYPELTSKRSNILGVIRDEEEKFGKALTQGLKHFEKELSKPGLVQGNVIPGDFAFFMFETYGFPLEVTEEIAAERQLTVDKEAFNKAFEAHQKISRAGGEKLFKGGLADNSEASTRLHTATHLLHEALRRVLGDHVEQKGSNITPERLRFDFSHPEKMTPEQVKQVEEIVNEQIKRDMEITIEDLTLEEAKARGAIGLFEDRYGSRINVYFMGDFSKEVCGGPHVKRTSELGSFKILKEEASSRGVRRIKAVVK
jgi:alanyl-tRNA synthetase